MKIVWDKEEQSILTRLKPKNPKQLEDLQNLINAVKNTQEESKQAVREKWLTYCKTSHINEIMKWRLEYMAQKLN